MEFLTKEGYSVQLLDTATKERLGIGPAMPGGPSYIVVHDTGVLGLRADEFLAQLKVEPLPETEIELDLKPDLAHLIVDDRQIIECVPVFEGTPEQAPHVHFQDSDDVHFLGGDPNQKAIAVMYCYGNDIDLDKAYSKLVNCLAYTCFTFGMPPRFCCVGHNFLDPKFQIDPVRGLAYGRRSFQQLVEDVIRVFGQLHELKNKLPKVQEFNPPINVRTSIRVQLRAGYPSTLSTLESTIAPETDIMCDGWTLDGDTISGNSIWLRDTQGRFFWSGAISKALFDQWIPANIPFPEPVVDWSKSCIELPDAWLQTQGEGIRIVLIDSGIDIEHPNLDHIAEDHRSGAVQIVNPTEDVEGHGTHCSGIVNARLYFGKGIKGIAPKAEVFVFKARDDRKGYNSRRVKEGIEWAKTKKADIISMSLNAIPQANLGATLKETASQGVVLLAAGGDNTELLNNKILFPARSPHCIAVGAINDRTFNQSIAPLYQQNVAAPLERLNFILPLLEMNSCFLTQPNGTEAPYFKKEKGSSMATAYMSGVFALLLSHLRNNEGRDQVPVSELIEKVLEHSKDLASDYTPMDGFIRIYNPKKVTT
ncbi:MAG: S8 family serine peptidase [Bacteroidota bacterium]